ncbi:hypothetical protein FGRMN_2562 [Fusarium graminum]|nr:hypothetical protein FGRMN_2562 [Fusarium graminum]
MNPQYLLQLGENPVAMIPPDGWPECQSNLPQDIKYYNIFVGQWESWARFDPKEDEKDWVDALDWARGSKLIKIAGAIGTRKRGRCYAYVVLACMKMRPENMQITNIGWRLQQWYPKADITMMHYNNNRPVVRSAFDYAGPEMTPTVVRDDVLPDQSLNSVPQQVVDYGDHIPQQGSTQQEESFEDLLRRLDAEDEYQIGDTQEESTYDLSSYLDFDDPDYLFPYNQ